MLLSPRALLRLGETYRQGGIFDGRRVLPESWVRASWTPQGRSPYTGHSYGYGWFITEARGHAVYYGRGYGGQMLYVVPSLALTVVVPSDPTSPSGRNGYRRQPHALRSEERRVGKGCVSSCNFWGSPYPLKKKTYNIQ